MDAYKTHGAFSWSELMTAEPAKAAEFYGSLFGWVVEKIEVPTGPYHVIKVDGTPMAGMMAYPDPSVKMPPYWSCYVTVNNVDETVAKCCELGGAVLMPAMDVPTVGRMACIRDPQGAAINIIAYAPKT
ncbi:VOC family protein [Roseateles oligotrophus]|uniref:VOC family protein n=1 Tax=Roseateles oligotrophus TaxID=1769250 RepID=A0ABT2Y954_9BURK|nr:VOC family protein [Roseateles oligotrophus]MCV2366835.1 VOC family protein [Roseateles oligotrophus]